MIHRYNGQMSDAAYKLYTAEQVRGIDYTAIHELGIAGYELMCRAGSAILAGALEHFPSSRQWLVMCGPGNNGGDGYVVARLAKDAGIAVTVCALNDPQLLKGDAAQAYADWLSVGGEVANWPLHNDTAYDLALDALLGTGIDREVGGKFKDAIEFLNRLDCQKLAIDIPSGLNADTGCVMGCAVKSRCTVTFVGRKRGMYTADGPDYCGHIVFDDLAIPTEAASAFAQSAGTLLAEGYLGEVLAPRLQNTHKGNFGHVFAVGGIEGMSGAIRLCGEAALRSGAGRVTLVTDPVHAGLVNMSRPELMVKAVEEHQNWVNQLDEGCVVAVGPGLGAEPWSLALLESCVKLDSALVVDADGLNLIAQQVDSETLQRGKWILTPHPAEAARLLGCKTAEIQGDRVNAALAIANRYNATVVLKGCGTVIADAGGNYAICNDGNPGMATPGSGDVLTGIIVALLGHGLSCTDAAKAGVLAHALAGDLAANDKGEMGLIAGDIIDQLPSVWKTITI
jgi:NAD(P)H-hydrate epimerase